MLQACLNGDRPRGAHPALPVTPQELAADAAAVAELAVTALHVHPRDAACLEVLNNCSRISANGFDISACWNKYKRGS